MWIKFTEDFLSKSQADRNRNKDTSLRQYYCTKYIYSTVISVIKTMKQNNKSTADIRYFYFTAKFRN